MRRSLTSLLVLLGLTLAAAHEGHAQSADRKTAISLSGSAYQYKGNFGSNFWNWSNNNYGPGFAVNRYLTSGLDVGLHLGYVELKGSQNTTNFFNTNVVHGNLAFKLKLNNGWAFKEDAFIQPYLLVAPGLTYLSREGQIQGRSSNGNSTHFDAFGAAGINFRISDGLGLFVQTGQHVPLSANIDGQPIRDQNSFDDRFLQHTVGLNIAFGKPKDTDGDGVPDRKDKCPDTPAGVAVDPNGCPLDRDGDGVPDYQDKCPDEKGLPTLEGCPDRDGDGVRDGDDQCPDTPGKVELQGCPDADNDGVRDSDDKCPDTPAGTQVDATGCPLVLDQDNDGVPDNLDKCPDTPAGARVDANGCPRVVNPKIKALEKPVRFKTNSTVIDPSSFPALNKMVKALKDSTDYGLRIIGHADSRGTDEYNQGLSERRAESLKRYFTSRGVDTSRVITEGRGESEPAAPNTSPANMSRNRRAEFTFDFFTTPAPQL
ncbi:OmpA family protein [Hymenobacter arizonensis]|uniref:Thrombospondin type 3 repeat-containing protein n=1 Tax=Hymenobacter arizonensis TaxID=1227077 RepID=A0A1I5YZM8_HYMAR|nr:OmpA family protein [Hymenobacter arizonensis]SFQ49728.1 Thrombospondin type 3 repeat-containing protein [Hymenobacter arizonensis]